MSVSTQQPSEQQGSTKPVTITTNRSPNTTNKSTSFPGSNTSNNYNNNNNNSFSNSNNNNNNGNNNKRASPNKRGYNDHASNNSNSTSSNTSHSNTKNNLDSNTPPPFNPPTSTSPIKSSTVAHPTSTSPTKNTTAGHLGSLSNPIPVDESNGKKHTNKPKKTRRSHKKFRNNTNTYQKRPEIHSHSPSPSSSTISSHHPYEAPPYKRQRMSPTPLQASAGHPQSPPLPLPLLQPSPSLLLPALLHSPPVQPLPRFQPPQSPMQPNSPPIPLPHPPHFSPHIQFNQQSAPELTINAPNTFAHPLPNHQTYPTPSNSYKQKSQFYHPNRPPSDYQPKNKTQRINEPLPPMHSPMYPPSPSFSPVFSPHYQFIPPHSPLPSPSYSPYGAATQHSSNPSSFDNPHNPRYPNSNNKNNNSNTNNNSLSSHHPHFQSRNLSTVKTDTSNSNMRETNHSSTHLNPSYRGDKSYHNKAYNNNNNNNNKQFNNSNCNKHQRFKKERGTKTHPNNKSTNSANNNNNNNKKPTDTAASNNNGNNDTPLVEHPDPSNTINPPTHPPEPLVSEHHANLPSSVCPSIISTPDNTTSTPDNTTSTTNTATSASTTITNISNDTKYIPPTNATDASASTNNNSTTDPSTILSPSTTTNPIPHFASDTSTTFSYTPSPNTLHNTILIPPNNTPTGSQQINDTSSNSSTDHESLSLPRQPFPTKKRKSISFEATTTNSLRAKYGPNTIYICNLPQISVPDLENELRSFFSTFGTITSLRAITQETAKGNRQAKASKANLQEKSAKGNLPEKPTKGNLQEKVAKGNLQEKLSKGTAYVTFETHLSVENAMKETLRIKGQYGSLKDLDTGQVRSYIDPSRRTAIRAITRELFVKLNHKENQHKLFRLDNVCYGITHVAEDGGVHKASAVIKGTYGSLGIYLLTEPFNSIFMVNDKTRTIECNHSLSLSQVEDIIKTV